MNGRTPTPAEGSTPSNKAAPPSWEGLELDLGSVSEDVVESSPPASPPTSQPIDFDDLDPLSDLDDGPLGIELGSGDLRTEEIGLSDVAMRPRAAVSDRHSGPASSRVFLNAHSRPKLGAQNILIAVATSIAAVVLAPFAQPPLIRVAEGWLPSLPFLLHGIAALLFFALWASSTARAVGGSQRSLYLVSLGSLTLLLVNALNLVGTLSNSRDALAFRRFMPYVVPIATGLVVGGFACACLGRAHIERSANKRTAWAATLALLGVSGLLLAIRVARFDLPLWRIDMPTQLPQIW